MFHSIADALTARQRASGHLTDRQVAALLGTPESTYSRWRNGTMVPRDHEAIRLADFLGLDVESTYVLLARSRTHRSKGQQPPTGHEGETVSKKDFDGLRAQVDQLVALIDTLIAARSTDAPAAQR